MGKVKIYIVSVLYLLLGLTGFGQGKPNEELNDYLKIAAQNNPELKAAFNEYLAALERIPQVGALPDPQASFGVFIKPMAIMGGNQVAEVQLMQMFPWFGTFKTARGEAAEMAKAKLEMFNTAKADLFYRITENWYNLVKADREISLLEENVLLLESIEKLALAKFQAPGSGAVSGNKAEQASMNPSASKNMSGGGMAGMAPAQNQRSPMPKSGADNAPMPAYMGSPNGGLENILRVKMEILEQKDRLALLRDRQITAETNFNALLNRDLNEKVPAPDSLIIQPLPAGKLAIADSILSNNPMLAMLDNEIKAYEQMEFKTKKMGRPMLGVGFNYMLNQKRDGNTFMMNGDDMIMPMFSVSIPIYRKKYDSMQREAQLKKEAGELKTIDLKNKLMVQYRNFIQNLNDAERKMQLYKEQEELARKTTDLLLAKFSSDGTGYEEVLRMQAKTLDYGFKYTEAVTAYNTSVALAEKLMDAIKID